MNEISPNNVSRWKKTFGRIVAALSVVAIMLGLMAFFGRYSFVAELVSNFRMQIAIVIIFLGVLMTYTQFRLWWSVCQFAIAIAVIFPIVWSFLPAQQVAPGPRNVSLLSYNILGDNADREPILETIKQHNADILVLVEYENSWVEDIDTAVSSYRYSIKEPAWTGFGIAVFSKFPMSNSKVEKSTEDSDIPVILTEISIGEQTLLLAAVHFLSPLGPDRMKIRNDQMANVTRLIEDYRQGRDLPVLLVGDFNCVAWSPFVTDMLRDLHLKDSRQGYFYHGSWPTFNWLASIPIDHAFVSDEIHVDNRQLLPVMSSDHFPLYLEFSISESGQQMEPASSTEE